jgi:hypothetical protein
MAHATAYTTRRSKLRCKWDKLTVENFAGVAQLAERGLSKPNVEGSTPFARLFPPSVPVGVFVACSTLKVGALLRNKMH